MYEWFGERPAAERLQPVSVLPANEVGEELAPAAGAVLGARNIRGRHAVSEDGSRVVWSSGVHLYLRDMRLKRTVQLDVPAAGCVASGECGGGEENARFSLASADGSRVLFADTQQLTSGASTSPGTADLYECRVIVEHAQFHCALEDLTPAPGPRSPSDVQAAIGASEDASWVYFVANGVLGDGAERGATRGNCTRTKATGEGHCNLYVAHDGSVHLIGALAVEDFRDWDAVDENLETLTARVSPDGRWLTFMSMASAALTSYDNHDATSGKLDEEVFLYHAVSDVSGSIACASCDPSGARPTGVEAGKLAGGLVSADAWPETTWLAANVPGWTPYSIEQSIYQSRYLADSGRLFFNTPDALVVQDINNQQDVYEYEPVGVGSCSEASKTFHAVDAGCVSLISSGRASGESGFLDASESGDDIFFLTGERLVSQDVDSAVDVYDAHVCTVSVPCLEEVEKPPACSTADACRVAPSTQPDIFGSPASETFRGPGDVRREEGSGQAVVLTTQQRLTKALKGCRAKYRRASKLRSVCEHRARVRYNGHSARSAHAEKRRRNGGRRVG